MSPPLSIAIRIPILLELPIDLLREDRQADCTVVLSTSWGKETVDGRCARRGVSALETIHTGNARGLLVAYLALLGDVESIDVGG
jgi:hypothetical protein